MVSPLPYGNFQWVENLSDLKTFILNYPYKPFVDEKSGINFEYDDPAGYILEVTVKYPKNLQNAHRDLPLLPYHDKELKKLITSVLDKEKYVVHYITLIQALDLGLELVEVHRAISFNQLRWMKKYIDLNTELRKHAKSKFLKDLYKLLNNIIFGKSMEDITRYRLIKLLTKFEGKKGAGALIASSRCKCF